MRWRREAGDPFLCCKTPAFRTTGAKEDLFSQGDFAPAGGKTDVHFAASRWFCSQPGKRRSDRVLQAQVGSVVFAKSSGFSGRRQVSAEGDRLFWRCRVSGFRVQGSGFRVQEKLGARILAFLEVGEKKSIFGSTNRGILACGGWGEGFVSWLFCDLGGSTFWGIHALGALLLVGVNWVLDAGCWMKKRRVFAKATGFSPRRQVVWGWGPGDRG